MCSCLHVGGWWEVNTFDDIQGGVAIETSSMRYMQALDNGMFSLGDEHAAGISPISVSGNQRSVLVVQWSIRIRQINLK